MESFRSEVLPDFFPDKFAYQDKILFLGSCFTENIGKKLASLKFPVLINPFGILYNPVSVSQSLQRAIKPHPFTKDDLVFFNEKYISFSHHGRFSGTSAEEVLKQINSELRLANIWIQESTLLFITFGTSWVYRHIKTDQLVTNCHKIPAAEFDHFMLGVQDITKIYHELFDIIHRINPKLKIVFTVSPVRHWKDGPVNNLLSKSVLIVAIHELIKSFDFVRYFPSYEIMMDDLRDYRFYADDMFHPNQLGIDYIWEKFRDTFILPRAIELSLKIDKLLKAFSHRPFYPNTEAYKKFILKHLEFIDELKSNNPMLDFDAERNHFLQEYESYFS